MAPAYRAGLAGAKGRLCVGCRGEDAGQVQDVNRQELSKTHPHSLWGVPSFPFAARLVNGREARGLPRAFFVRG
jgi:hypothetical protein